MTSGRNSITLDEPAEISELMQFMFKDILKGPCNFIIRTWLLRSITDTEVNNENIQHHCNVVLLFLPGQAAKV
jgi:hypothetical protein